MTIPANDDRIGFKEIVEVAPDMSKRRMQGSRGSRKKGKGAEGADVFPVFCFWAYGEEPYDCHLACEMEGY